MNDEQYWKFGFKELACVGTGLLFGAAFGFGLLFVKPAPPWWFLPLPTNRSGRPIVEIDTWKQYELQGGYEVFWLQSTLGWAVAAGILGLIISNVILRKKDW